MTLIVTVIAYPREAGIWKMRLSGINDHQYALLRRVNPYLKNKCYGSFLTAKWSAQGAGGGRYVPMAYITPVLNILESWGYVLATCSDVEKCSGLGKIWTLRLTPCSPYFVDRYLECSYYNPKWCSDRYHYYHSHYPSLPVHCYCPPLPLPLPHCPALCPP